MRGVRLLLSAALLLAAGAPASAAPAPLSAQDRALGTACLHYMQANRLKTGLVSSGAKFPATTMWDVGSQLAGMVAARELGLLGPKDFDAWMRQVLTSLAALRLYHGELPNKAYNGETLLPVDYGSLAPAKEIGFSAIDLGRLVRWLDIVAARYPQHRAAARAVTARWKTARLAQGGSLMGTSMMAGQEQWVQEGRLGYAQYAARSLLPLGVQAADAARPDAHLRWVSVSGVRVPVDTRDMTTSGGHNYVTSEPYVLDGLETGFKALPAPYARAVLAAQEARYKATGVLTAWSEDNLDRAPYFAYNCLYVDGQAWTTLDANGHAIPQLRGSSFKAAAGWHALFGTPYTAKLMQAMRPLVDPAAGAFAGTYEALKGPNRALTLNTNGVVLEALWYGRVKRPLEDWAHDRP